MKRIAWMTLPVMLLCFACTGRDTSTMQPVLTKAPDIVTEKGGIAAAFYNSENPHTMRMLEEALIDPVVTAQIESFETKGYTLAPEYSFVAEGERDDGGEVKITTLVMENTAQMNHDAVYLFCLHGINRNVVVPVTLTFSKETPGIDFEQIGENVWLGLAGAPVTTNVAGAIGRIGNNGRTDVIDSSMIESGVIRQTPVDELDYAAAMISWRQWLRCVSEHTIAGTISCALVCMYAPGGYLQCISVCAAGNAVYAFIKCSIAQL